MLSEKSELKKNTCNIILLHKDYNKAPLNNTLLRETNLSEKKMKSKGINTNKIGKSNQSLLQGGKDRRWD